MFALMLIECQNTVTQRNSKVAVVVHFQLLVINVFGFELVTHFEFLLFYLALKSIIHLNGQKVKKKANLAFFIGQKYVESR